MRTIKFFRKKSSGDLAKDRLKLLLVADRANCSPDLLELIRTDKIQAISKYIEIDTDGLELQISHAGAGRGARPSLFADIPIRSVKPCNRQTT